LSEIGLFYYKPKDIFCQHKNNYLRRVAATGHIASVSLPHFKKTKKQRIILHRFHSKTASRVHCRVISVSIQLLKILSLIKISSQRKIIVIALPATLFHDFETAMEKRTFSAFSTA